MKWYNKGHEFDVFASKVCEDGYEYYIWGAGLAGKAVYQAMKNRLPIVGFIDNDKRKQVEGVEKLTVYSQDNIDFSKRKVRYLISQVFYSEMSSVLKAYQLKENEDFFNCLTFARIYLLYKFNEVFVYRTDISITDKCTLKCKKCNMFMPYFETPHNHELHVLKADIDAYFKVVDYVVELKVLGGEPFLHPHLKEFLKYIADNYSCQIGNIEIYTNATLRLSEDLLDFIRIKHITIGITDYTNTVDYENRLNDFLEDLKGHSIHYKCNKAKTWVDFGFPDNPYNLEGEEKLIRHFDACNFEGLGLYNKRLYFCHMYTSATRCGLFRDSDEDYIDLEHVENKAELVEFEMGYCKKGYHDFCKVCRGCKSTIVIPAGEQRRK